MPSCSHSYDLSTGEQCPQPLLAPTGSSCQHGGGGQAAGIAHERRESRARATPTSCWTPPC